MRSRFLAAAFVAVFLQGLGLATDTVWTPAKAWDGHADLQGLWVNNHATPLERPKEFAGRATLTDQEVRTLQERADRIFKDGKGDFAVGDDVFFAALRDQQQYRNAASTVSSLDNVDKVFDNRTSLITDPADGRLPPLTAEAQQRRAAAAARRRGVAGVELLNGSTRCITWGVPRLGAGSPYYSYYAIVQSPGYVVIDLETETRVVPMDGRAHLPSTVRQWNGDSRGRWEGSTLVVDTTNFSTRSNFMGSAENLHLVERFTRMSKDLLKYEMTIDDPTTWTKPWTAELHLSRVGDDTVYEFACHEGNYEVLKGVLDAGRADEK
jgi:hypothetical protein